jgi:anti-sigma regulatory factor (Ser/Thr protein kinase)
MEDAEWVPVDGPNSVAAVRRRAAKLAVEVGFDEPRAAEVGIVATELATNLAKHAGTGVVLLRRARSRETAGVELVSTDSGPGMKDIDLYATDGYSTAGTLGIGLGAVRRLASSYDAYSLPGRGTVIAAAFWPDRRPRPAAARVSSLTRPMDGESTCGDGVAVRVDDNVVIVLLVDGLGHGPLAAFASREAVRVFLSAPVASPGTLLAAVHEGIRATRGAAAAVAEIDRDAGRLRYAGLGNISGWIEQNERREGMVSVPGIAGGPGGSIREMTYDLAPDAVVVLHSDGLTSRWSLGDYPGLRARSAVVVASTLLRDVGRRRDDASVSVAVP